MEFDVHFSLNGYFSITANDEEEARKIANQIIQERIEEVEGIVHTALENDDYTTDVVER